MATELAEDLAAFAFEVTAVAARAGYLGGKPLPSPAEHRGITVRRVAATSFVQRTLLHRAVDYGSFYALAALEIARLPRQDTIIALTTPQSSYDADGSSLQTFGALRATLTSSSVCPCVGQQPIGSKEGEATAFRELVPRVCDELGGQFRIVTGDAGLCARENATLVTKLGLWYLFGLKGNQPHLHGLARECQHYSIGKPLARTAEKYRGNTIVRELFSRTVAGDPEADIEDAQQLWYVCQATYSPKGECTAVEQRYFLTSIPAGA